MAGRPQADLALMAFPGQPEQNGKKMCEVGSSDFLSPAGGRQLWKMLAVKERLSSLRLPPPRTPYPSPATRASQPAWIPKGAGPAPVNFS